MKRRVYRRETEILLSTLRERIPGLVLRTTLIAGFPGETEAEFEELRAFVEERQFERLGVFTYSCEPNTPAAGLPDHVAEEIKTDRRDRLMITQQSIAFAHGDRQIGRKLDVILDFPVPDEKDVWIGRTYADAPEVDPVVYVTGENLGCGQVVPCEIVARNDYDLVGVAVGPPR